MKFSAASDDGIEQDADRFASYLLLPPGSFEDKVEEVKKKHSTLQQADLIPLEQLYGLSHQAMLWRLTNDGVISPAENLSLKEGVISAARRLGYDISLYKTVPDDLAERKVLGHYIQMAEDLFAKEAISSGKYDELLLAGYRSDFVYGDEEGDLIAD
jgi:Zn-dependent peptidase ImmA (M78 family)